MRVVGLYNTSMKAAKAGRLNSWYGIRQKCKRTQDGNPIIQDAPADMSGAPYPLIFTEPDSADSMFLSHLATHGFVMVVVKPLSPSQVPNFTWIEDTRDFLFSLDQLASKPPDGLDNLMDTDHVGVTGFSYGGDLSLALSGARLDPKFYQSQCAQMTDIVPIKHQWVYEDWTCQEFGQWDAFVSFAGKEITTSEDGLWQPLTDARIRAVMPMAPSVSWYFGERGLAVVDRPVLLLWGTKDTMVPYELEAESTFEKIGTPESYLISFVGENHSMPYAQDAVQRVKHFATAFFGFYLQDREDYAQYFSEDFVSQFDDLAWGVYSDE